MSPARKYAVARLFGEFRAALYHLAEDLDRPRVMPRAHLRNAGFEQPVGLRVARAAPCEPDRLFGHFAHDGILVGQAFCQQRPVGGQAVASQIDYAGEAQAGVRVFECRERRSP